MDLMIADWVRSRTAGAQLTAVRVSDMLPPALRSPRGEITVLLVPHENCSACREYLDQLRQLRREFEVWEGELVADAPRDSASLLIADRYGQVFHVTHAGSGHTFPEPREVAEWLKFLGTLCPE